MRSTLAGLFFTFFLAAAGFGQAHPALSPLTQQFVTVDAPVIALTHVRVIDGTGAPPREDQTVVIERGRIAAIGDASSTPPPAGAKVIDLQGETVIPGLVGMHDHLFYPNQVAERRTDGPVIIYNEMGFSFPRLYLACGVTTLRTTGSIEPYTDLSLKKLIDEGKTPGPNLYITGPYLEGSGSYTPNMHELTGPEDATRTVNYWAEEGATSFKAYMHITRAELKAAVVAAHARSIKVTGHLCSIGFTEAAALGIDDLEHGLFVDTEFVPGKKADVCPSQQLTGETMAKLDMESTSVQTMIHDLVSHHVAVTSTMPVFEISVPGRLPLEPRVLGVLSAPAQVDYLTIRALVGQRTHSNMLTNLHQEMQFERDFVKAGGLLLAGLDPTGYGGVVAGFGDQREVELLVEAGFTPVEAIHIATQNGAIYLGQDSTIGTLAPGKTADLVVIQGNPAANISDIEKVQTVFKNGIGYDSTKLIESVQGAVGLH
ncbi:MAG TPA: amidohydrolase family protein [Terriglobia bacterium]|nr:amidohydrolase family protein [Terriglobia bacterium]